MVNATARKKHWKVSNFSEKLKSFRNFFWKKNLNCFNQNATQNKNSKNDKTEPVTLDHSGHTL
jgi:hypothetical protein